MQVCYFLTTLPFVIESNNNPSDRILEFELLSTVTVREATNATGIRNYFYE